ncbi:hypothetical protein BGZ52_012188, partial [Haplosporangium bisporale]
PRPGFRARQESGERRGKEAVCRQIRRTVSTGRVHCSNEIFNLRARRGSASAFEVERAHTDHDQGGPRKDQDCIGERNNPGGDHPSGACIKGGQDPKRSQGQPRSVKWKQDKETKVEWRGGRGRRGGHANGV